MHDNVTSPPATGPHLPSDDAIAERVANALYNVVSSIDLSLVPRIAIDQIESLPELGGALARTKVIVRDPMGAHREFIRLGRTSSEISSLTEWIALYPPLMDALATDAAGVALPKASQADGLFSQFLSPIVVRALERHDSPSFEEIKRLTLDALTEARQTEMPCRHRVVLANCRVRGDEPMQLGAVTLRALTIAEVNEWYGGGFSSAFGFDYLSLDPERCALLETSSKRLKSAGAPCGQAKDLFAPLVAALRLYYNHPIAELFSEDSDLSSLGRGRRTAYRSLEAVVPARVVNLIPDDSSAIAQLADALSRGPNARRLELALARWGQFIHRTKPEDLLIDAWIGLESIYLADTETSEITYRGSLRIAACLGADTEERTGLFETAKRLYAFRSKVAHGKGPQPTDIARAAEQTRELLRRSLLKISSMPAAIDNRAIDKKILGGEWPVT